MSRHVDEAFWVADDGSYGYGRIAMFQKDNWSDKQHAWLERYLDSTDEPDIDIVKGIDDGEEPEWEDDYWMEDEEGDEEDD